MIKQSITPQDVCDLLNELLRLDPKCILTLIAHREPCNDSISEHPTVQVQPDTSSDHTSQVGILGIINGMFGVRDDGMGPICYETEDAAGSGIETPVGFKLTPPIKTRVW